MTEILFSSKTYRLMHYGLVKQVNSSMQKKLGIIPLPFESNKLYFLKNKYIYFVNTLEMYSEKQIFRNLIRF